MGHPEEITVALKRVLRCRRDTNYRFTDEDIAALVDWTGLERAAIVRWALDVRGYYDTHEAIEKFFERNGTEENTLVSQCHVTMWNTDLDIVQKLWNSNLFSFLAYGISETLGVAQLYLDFKKRTYTHALKSQLETLGCTEVSTMTFANDGGKLAGGALYSVQKIRNRLQCVGGSFGECNRNVAKFAEEKRAEAAQAAMKDSAETAAKTEAALKASLHDISQKQVSLIEGQDSLKEGQSSLKEGVSQISEHMVTHDDVQGLRSDSVDAMRELEKRFSQTQQALEQSQQAEAETKKALEQSQRAEAETKKALEQSQLAEAETKKALQQSQQAEAKTKRALQEAGKHLTDEQTKNYRQAKMLARLNEDLKDQNENVRGLQKAKSKLELDNAQLKTKLSNLQNLQTMQEDIGSLKTRIVMIADQLTNSFKTQDAHFKAQDEHLKVQDKRLDAIRLQGADILTTVTHIETMHDVAFTGSGAAPDSTEPPDLHEEEAQEEDDNLRMCRKRRRNNEDMDAYETQETQAWAASTPIPRT